MARAPRSSRLWRFAVATLVPALPVAGLAIAGGANGRSTHAAERALGRKVLVQPECLACHRLGDKGKSGPGRRLDGVGEGLSRAALTAELRRPPALMPSYDLAPFPRHAPLGAAPTRSAGNQQPPDIIAPALCPTHPLPLRSSSLRKAAGTALRAERPRDRPKVVSARRADRGGARGGLVLRACGRPVWRRTVSVEIDLRRYHPSASLSERVSFVARTRAGYRVYALGH